MKSSHSVDGGAVVGEAGGLVGGAGASGVNCGPNVTTAATAAADNNPTTVSFAAVDDRNPGMTIDRSGSRFVDSR